MNTIAGWALYLQWQSLQVGGKLLPDLVSILKGAVSWSVPGADGFFNHIWCMVPETVSQ
jgi:hypothetical protein